jgi:hypothetical protein
MTHRFDHVAVANETLEQNLLSLEQMLLAFSRILGLEIASQAKQIKKSLQKATELYFYETWDVSEVITSSMDLVFSELEFETSVFSEQVDELDKSIQELARIYQQFVLAHALVMLVSSLEVYLSTVFRVCLSEKLNLNERAILQIVSQFNFQNWGSSVNAFRTFLEIELCPQEIDGSQIDALLTKRHVLVHRMGMVDERAIRQLNLPAIEIGERLRIKPSDVMEGIKLVSRIAEHLWSDISRLKFDGF